MFMYASAFSAERDNFENADAAFNKRIKLAQTDPDITATVRHPTDVDAPRIAKAAFPTDTKQQEEALALLAHAANLPPRLSPHDLKTRLENTITQATLRTRGVGPDLRTLHQQKSPRPRQ
ncbi:hypothetical protein [Trueperella pyogenes]|uniref:hypothetical protein n=2 Tax=Trueperella pyogenes TaxID=1661 RepID=UPI00117FEE8B